MDSFLIEYIRLKNTFIFLSYITKGGDRLDIGTIFRDLRTDRGLTLKDVTTGEISYSQLSKFERGESSITIHHLIQVVHNVGISFAEFMQTVEEFENPYKFFIFEIDKAYKKGNIDDLEAIVQTQEALYSETDILFYKYNAIMTKLIMSNLTETKISKAEKILISDYIINCSVWTSYEVILLGNSFGGLARPLQDALMSEIIKKLPTFDETNAIKMHLLNILINICVERLRSGITADVKEILAVIRPELSTNAYYFKTRILFLQGLIHIIEGQHDQGLLQCDQAIGVFALFDEPYAEMHQQELETFKLNYA